MNQTTLRLNIIILQLTAVNHYLDLSIVYGNSDQMNQQLREFRGGRLRVETRNNQDWPPRNANSSQVCSIRSTQEACYVAGNYHDLLNSN